MHVHTSEVVISQCNRIANNEKPTPPQFDETIPGRVSSFWTHQQGLSRHDQKPKSHICNNMKNLVSIYYKFLRTHHTRSACYHFGTGIPSVSKMQYTTQRVYSKRDLFETLTSMNIARDHHNRIIHWFIELQRQSTRFICMFIRVKSRDGLVKLWGGWAFHYLQFYYTVK